MVVLPFCSITEIIIVSLIVDAKEVSFGPDFAEYHPLESSPPKSLSSKLLHPETTPLPFVSQKSILSPAGKRSVRSSKFSDGPHLGIVLEGKNAQARGERSLPLVLIPFSQLARAAWSPGFLPK